MLIIRKCVNLVGECIANFVLALALTRYSIFRHEKIGIVIELDESSLGDLRCCYNDFEPPFVITKYGKMRPSDRFCMSDIVAGLRSNRISGDKMVEELVLSFGNWKAQVTDSMILIQNTFAVCCYLHVTDANNQFGTRDKFDLDRSLRIILTEDSVVLVGLSPSINMLPAIFRISNGVPEPISMSQDTLSKFLADIRHNAENLMPKNSYVREN